jgi:hypothetical protein
MPSESLIILYRSGYFIAFALGVGALFDFLPTWVPITVGVAAFILHWQCNIKRDALEKEAQNQLYARYAPDLETRDFVKVTASILERIDKLKAKNPAMSGVFSLRLQELNEHLGKTTPTPIMHALLRDFEFAAEYFSIAHPDAIEKAKVLVDRTTDLKRWLDLTGTAPTQEEMDEASDKMLRAKRPDRGQQYS